MSGDHDNPRRDLPPHQDPNSDLFVMRFSNPHTAIPDWLICTSKIRLEVRHMAAVIMILSKRGLPPTKNDIAEVLDVEPRTVQRWLAELRAAGVLSYKLVGKRRLYVFHEPPTIIDPGVSDRSIRDRMASPDPSISDPTGSHEGAAQLLDHGIGTTMNGSFQPNSITDPSGGGGSLDSPEDSELPTTNAPRRTKVLPQHITTETGRWLVKMGFNIVSAHRFQSIPLGVAQADYARRRNLGQGNGAMINAWSVELPEFDQQSVGPIGIIDEARRAELRAQYGDLFRYGSDTEGLESEEDE